MSAVRIKICGITRIEDALLAAEAGADALGFVFYPNSPRAVTIEQAQAIVAELPPFVQTVGLFVNASRREIDDVLDSVPLGLLQFHGDEGVADCECYHKPYLKALRVHSGMDVAAVVDAYPSAAGVLLDTYVQGVPGGTGEAFDWSLVPVGLSKPVILAGGLHAQNVRAAIAAVKPYAVDVSGGVELSKGLKDAAKVRAFIRACRE